MAKIEYLIFSVSGKFYAIEVLYVQEINRFKELIINKIPNTPSKIYGLLNLRGNVIPIVDLRIELNLNVTDITKNTRIIIINNSKKLVGFLVDKVESIDTFAEYDILEPPDETKINNSYVDKLINNNNKIIFILNIQKLFEGSNITTSVKK